MNSLKKQVILALNAFFVLIIGCFLVFFLCFMEDYFIRGKKKEIQKVFETIQKVKILEIAESIEISDLLMQENYGIIIGNKTYHILYTSKKYTKEKIAQKILFENMEYFQEKPKIKYYPEEYGKPVRLYATIRQENNLYYLVIYENTKNMHKSIQYTQIFLVIILLVFLGMSCIFSFFLANEIARPVMAIRKTTDKLARKDYSARIMDKMPANEIGQMSADINNMAEAIQRSVSDLNNYNYLLRKQNESMVEAEKQRKKMVSNMTHHLKTPLAIISSQVELLVDEKRYEKREDYYSSIMDEIDKMSLLISNILQNSRAERKIMNANMETLNLSMVLLELIPKYVSWLSLKKIRFTYFIEEDCVVQADRMQIEQAVHNYMLNACSHTSSGAGISLRLYGEKETYCISIYNDGKRIPEEELDSIWCDFYQISSETQADVNRAGLGLYIVKDIMYQHNGSCGVKNRENGVEFWMKLEKKS